MLTFIVILARAVEGARFEEFTVFLRNPCLQVPGYICVNNKQTIVMLDLKDSAVKCSDQIKDDVDLILRWR